MCSVFLTTERRRQPEYMETTYMTWVKPTFEVIDLCSEVTSYLYKR
jgi:hypothetical protein